MKTFLLINAPIYWERMLVDEEYLSPLGLGYIATYIEQENISVDLLDCVNENIPVKEIIAYIDERQPDFLGINIFTQNYDIVKYIVEHITVRCECYIGGQSVKSIYDYILEWNCINNLNIIIGEGEFIIPAILTNKCKQIPEVIIKNKKVYRVNRYSEYFPTNLDEINLNRKFLKNELMRNHYNQNEISLITSRGCSYNCTFCGGALDLNRDVNIRINKDYAIRDEIRYILEMYPEVQSIRILDDLFLRNANSIDSAIKIFNMFPELKWRGMVHVLSLLKNTEQIEELKLSGCEELFMGIESGSEKIRRKINKLGSVENVLKVSKAILEQGIDLKGYFIYGFPNETVEDFEKTYRLAYTINEISKSTSGNFRTSVFQFRPYHGTQIYNELVETGITIGSCNISMNINQFEGRNQFNFDFGNFSEETDEILNEYIVNTQMLRGE
ncbi:MAG: radical SAM protein [Eubacteriales bacterium]